CGVREEGVVAPHGEQCVVVVLVFDPAHDQPGGDLVAGAGEGGVAGFGDLGLRDQLAGIGIFHRAGVAHRLPRVLGDVGDGALDRGVHADSDGEIRSGSPGGGDDLTGVVGRVRAYQ